MRRDVNGQDQIVKRTLALLLSGMLVVGGVPTDALAEAGVELGRVAASQDGTSSDVREMDVADGAARDVPVPVDATAADAGSAFAIQSQEAADRYANVTLRIMGGSNATWDLVHRGQSGKLEGVADLGSVGITSLGTGSATIVGPNGSTTAELGLDEYVSHVDYHAGVLSIASEGEGASLSYTAELTDGRVIRLAHTGSLLRQVVAGDEDGTDRELVKFTFCDGHVEAVSCEPMEDISGAITYVGFDVNECQDISAAEVTLEGGDEYECMGTEIRPYVSQVALGGSQLLYLNGRTQYEVSYENNVLPGTGTVVVTGTGRYTGTVRKSFSIVGEMPARVNISSATVSVAGWEYDGKTHEVAPAVTFGGKTLAAGTDYTVSGATSATDAGTYSVTVTGTGAYEGTVGATYEVARRQATVTADDKSKTEGEPDPELTATVSGTLGSDSLSYEPSRVAGESAGTYAVTPSGPAEQGNYRVAYVPGTLTVAAAQQPSSGDDIDALKREVEEAKKARDDAKEAYDAAVAKVGDVDVEAAASAESSAQQALEAARAEDTAARAAAASAKTALDDAASAKAAAESALGKARVAEDAARQAFATAESKLAAATAERDEAASEAKGLEEIEKKLREASEALEAAKADLATKRTAAQQAAAAYEQACNDVKEAQGLIERQTVVVQQAQAAADAAAAGTTDELAGVNYEQGSLGLMQWLAKRGYDTSVAQAMLTGDDFEFHYSNRVETAEASTKPYLQYTHLGEEDDATSLENVRAAIALMREANDVRAFHNRLYGLTADNPTVHVKDDNGNPLYYKDGLPAIMAYLAPLNVSAYAMTVSEVYANHAAVDFNHLPVVAQATGIVDNLDASDIDPFWGWYVDEQNYWRSLFNNFSPIDENCIDQYATEYVNIGHGGYIKKQTGHFTQFISPSHVNQGMGVHTGSFLSALQNTTAHGFEDDNSFFHSATWTVYEFSDLFENYVSLVEAKQNNTTPKTPEQITLEREQAKLKEYQQDLQAKNAAKTAAETAKNAADADVNETQTVVNTAQAAYDSALAASQGTNAEAVMARKDAADAAYASALQARDRAYDDHQTAQAALRLAEGAAADAGAAWTSADGKHSAAQARVEAAAAALSGAKDAHDKAAARLAQVKVNAESVAPLREALDAAEDRLTKAEQALSLATDVERAIVSGVGDVTYTGTAVEPDPTVQVGSATLEAGRDYEASFANNINRGTATLTVTGKGDYQGTKSVTFQILPAKITSVEVSQASVPYDGKAKTPGVTVRAGSITVPESGYTVRYANNSGVGIATVTVTGTGNFEGAKSATFRIELARSFPDVPGSAWFAGVVSRAVGLGLLSGYKDGRFGPNDRVTRGQVAVILWNMAGGPAAGAGARDFPDAQPGEYYYDAVRWASSAGVVSGYGNGRFGSDDDVTREQLAVMLANYSTKVAGKAALGSASDYASMADRDKVSVWAAYAVGWCFRNGILSGSGGKVNPQGSATRAEAAKMVVGLHDLLA